jgi:hypothetical protein
MKLLLAATVCNLSGALGGSNDSGATQKVGLAEIELKFKMTASYVLS